MMFLHHCSLTHLSKFFQLCSMGNKPVPLASSPQYLALVLSSGWRLDDGQDMVASSQLNMLLPYKSAYEESGRGFMMVLITKGSSHIFNLLLSP